MDFCEILEWIKHGTVISRLGFVDDLGVEPAPGIFIIFIAICRVSFNSV